MVSNPFFGLRIVVWGGRGRCCGHGQREDDCLDSLHSVNGTVSMTEALVVVVALAASTGRLPLSIYNLFAGQETQMDGRYIPRSRICSRC